MQEQLSRRIALVAKQEATEAQVENLLRTPNALCMPGLVHLRIDPAELLRKVPFFRQLSPADVAEITAPLSQHTVTAGEDIVPQHEPHLIARGAVRVPRQDKTSDRQGPASAVATRPEALTRPASLKYSLPHLQIYLKHISPLVRREAHGTIPRTGGWRKQSSRTNGSIAGTTVKGETIVSSSPKPKPASAYC